jgi:hypothetical protein
MPGLPGFDMVCFLRPLSYSRCHPRTPSDARANPAMHAAFMFLFVVFMLALLRTVFCDPGICMAKTKDALKPVREIPQGFLLRAVVYT